MYILACLVNNAVKRSSHVKVTALVCSSDEIIDFDESEETYTAGEMNMKS